MASITVIGLCSMYPHIIVMHMPHSRFYFLSVFTDKHPKSKHTWENVDMNKPHQLPSSCMTTTAGEIHGRNACENAEACAILPIKVVKECSFPFFLIYRCKVWFSFSLWEHHIREPEQLYYPPSMCSIAMSTELEMRAPADLRSLQRQRNSQR